jgi:hypothetical protein
MYSVHVTAFLHATLLYQTYTYQTQAEVWLWYLTDWSFFSLRLGLDCIANKRSTAGITF